MSTQRKSTLKGNILPLFTKSNYHKVKQGEGMFSLEGSRDVMGRQLFDSNGSPNIQFQLHQNDVVQLNQALTRRPKIFDLIEDEVALHRSHSIKIADYQSNMRGSGEKITGNLPPLSMQ